MTGTIQKAVHDAWDRTVPDARVRLHRFDLPLAEPFEISYDTITAMPNLLAVADDGPRQGFGEAAPLSSVTGEGPQEVIDAVDGFGLDASPADLDSPAGRAAVEGATLDLAARRKHVPVVELLGGGVGPVPTSLTIPLGDPDLLGARVEEALQAGFSILKVKAGAEISDDLDRLSTVRARAGDEIPIRVDPNQGWTLEETLEALDVLEDLDVEALEQPLAVGDLEGHAALRDQTTIPLMLDEEIFTPDDARQAIAAEAADILNIKLMKSGGIATGAAIADVADRAGLTCMVGCMIESRVGIAQAAHLVGAHDAITRADLDGATFLAEDPVEGGPVLEDGALVVPDRPGLGIDGVDAGEFVAKL